MTGELALALGVLVALLLAVRVVLPRLTGRGAARRIAALCSREEPTADAERRGGPPAQG